jgi:hypothetical protein
MNQKLILLFLPVAAVVIMVGVWEHGRMLVPTQHHAGSQHAEVDTDIIPDDKPEDNPSEQASQLQVQKAEHTPESAQQQAQAVAPVNVVSAASAVKYKETQREHPGIYPELPRLPDSDPAPHCPLAKGAWCGPYWSQAPVPALPPPRGDKECPGNCNGVGVCDHDTGARMHWCIESCVSRPAMSRVQCACSMHHAPCACVRMCTLPHHMLRRRMHLPRWLGWR